VDVDDLGGNRVADPLFCDQDSLDFRLQDDSPCWTEDCGIIGASDLNCDGVSVEERDGSYPAVHAFRLGDPWPNPFNPVVHIPLTVSHPGRVSVSVFNLLGERVAVLQDDYLAAGDHRYHWDGRGYSSGVYMIQAGVDDRLESRKVLLLR